MPLSDQLLVLVCVNKAGIQGVAGGRPQRQLGRRGSQAPSCGFVAHHPLPHQQRGVPAACVPSRSGLGYPKPQPLNPKVAGVLGRFLSEGMEDIELEEWTGSSMGRQTDFGQSIRASCASWLPMMGAGRWSPSSSLCRVHRYTPSSASEVSCGKDVGLGAGMGDAWCRGVVDIADFALLPACVPTLHMPEISAQPSAAHPVSLAWMLKAPHACACAQNLPDTSTEPSAAMARQVTISLCRRGACSKRPSSTL